MKAFVAQKSYSVTTSPAYYPISNIEVTLYLVFVLTHKFIFSSEKVMLFVYLKSLSLYSWGFSRVPVRGWVLFVISALTKHPCKYLLNPWPLLSEQLPRICTSLQNCPQDCSVLSSLFWDGLPEWPYLTYQWPRWTNVLLEIRNFRI